MFHLIWHSSSQQNPRHLWLPMGSTGLGRWIGHSHAPLPSLPSCPKKTLVSETGNYMYSNPEGTCTTLQFQNMDCLLLLDKPFPVWIVILPLLLQPFYASQKDIPRVLDEKLLPRQKNRDANYARRFACLTTFPHVFGHTSNIVLYCQKLASIGLDESQCLKTVKESKMVQHVPTRIQQTTVVTVVKRPNSAQCKKSIWNLLEHHEMMRGNGPDFNSESMQQSVPGRRIGYLFIAGEMVKWCQVHRFNASFLPSNQYQTIKLCNFRSR